MIPYADFTDLSLRYGDIAETDRERAEVLLADASAYILANGGVESPDQGKAPVYRMVCCAMVHRAWSALAGITQYSQTAGAFTESFSYGNPNGDLYMTKAERRTLGLGQSKVGTIAPVCHRADGEPEGQNEG